MISLRDVSATDLPTFYAQQADPEVAAMAGFTPRTHDAFMTHWTTNVLGSATGRSQAVLLDGVLAGYLLAFDRDGHRQIGYWYGREFWGRGVASAALGQFLALEPHRPLHAYVIPSNPASARVLLKNGFVAGDRHLAPDGVEEVQFTLTGT